MNLFIKHNNNKPLSVGSAVNVLYFTNKCNLACTYCYEDLANRPPQVMTKTDIEKYVDEVLKRENDESKQTLFVLFGGEVTLEWDNVCHMMKYAWSKKKNVHFNMETNGIKFLSQIFINEVKNNYFYKMGFLSMDVSFDGVGNGDRIFHNGMDSTSSMIQIFKNLDKNNIKYRIRYTIQKSNIDHLYEDISGILKAFNPLRIITSIAWDTFGSEDHIKIQEAKDLLRKDWINKSISVPICEVFCDMCDGCGERKESKAYFTNEGNVAFHKNDENMENFNHFKNKDIV